MLAYALNERLGEVYHALSIPPRTTDAPGTCDDLRTVVAELLDSFPDRGDAVDPDEETQPPGSAGS